jgi:hypothetical protein
MWPYSVIVFDIFFDEVSEMSFSKDKEVIQAFPLYCSYPSFCIKVKIG